MSDAIRYPLHNRSGSAGADVDPVCASPMMLPEQVRKTGAGKLYCIRCAQLVDVTPEQRGQAERAALADGFDVLAHRAPIPAALPTSPLPSPAPESAKPNVYRRWHPTHGQGTFVSHGNLSGKWVTDLGGPIIPLDVTESQLGRPGKKLVLPRDGKPGNEEWHWWTLTLRSGETFMFRDEDPALSPPVAVTERTPANGTRPCGCGKFGPPRKGCATPHVRRAVLRG